MNCESCARVGLESAATTKRNGESLCEDCAHDVDLREKELRDLSEAAYDERGIRK